MSKIPTAEEFTLHKTPSKYLTRTDIKLEQHYDLMIEFAKLHVEAALLAAEEEVDGGLSYVYPLENIK